MTRPTHSAKPPAKALMSWSSGKDSALTLHRARQDEHLHVVALLTTTNEVVERVAIHGVHNDILRAQADRLNLRLVNVPLPWPCSNEIYLHRMGAAVRHLRDEEGITDHIFGDLFLEDVRAYREDNLAPLNVKLHFPLWGEDTRRLAHEMIDMGLVAHIAAIDLNVIPAELCGVRFDHDFLKALPDEVDPCGEYGEFHTMVVDMPDFSSPIAVEAKQTVTFDNIMYREFTLI